MKSITNFKLAPLAATMVLMIDRYEAVKTRDGYTGPVKDLTGSKEVLDFTGKPSAPKPSAPEQGELSITLTPSDTEEFDQSDSTGEENLNQYDSEAPTNECSGCGIHTIDQFVDGKTLRVHLVANANCSMYNKFIDIEEKASEIRKKHLQKKSVRERLERYSKHHEHKSDTTQCKHEIPGEVDHPDVPNIRQVSARQLVGELNEIANEHATKTNEERFKLMRDFFQSKYCQLFECAATSVACCLPVTVLYNGAVFCEKGCNTCGRAMGDACNDPSCRDGCCEDGECGFKDTRDTKCAGATAACSFGMEHCVNNDQRNKGHDELVDCFVAAWDDVKSRFQKNFVAPCETDQSGTEKTCEVTKNTLKCIFCPLTSTWYYGCNWGCCEDKPGNDFQNITNPICCKKELLENGQLESDCSILARETGPCVARTSHAIWKAVKKCVGTTVKCGFHCVKNGITGTYDKIVTCPCKTGQFFKESCAEGPSQFCCICCNKCDTRIQRETGKDECDKCCKCFFKETCGWCWCCCQVTLETGETMEGCMALCELIGCLARFCPSS